LISPEYLDQLHKMRSEAHRPRWGNGGQRHVPKILSVIATKQPASILDYGCGLGMLLAELKKFTTLPMAGYDPGIPEHATLPDPADLVVSTDVLEHIEPDKLNGVLTHIRMLTGRAAYLNVHTGPANAKLPDGRNAHLTQQPATWWQKKLLEYFTTVEMLEGGHRPTFLCE
jgi:hypothetical protein